MIIYWLLTSYINCWIVNESKDKKVSSQLTDLIFPFLHIQSEIILLLGICIRRSRKLGKNCGSQWSKIEYDCRIRGSGPGTKTNPSKFWRIVVLYRTTILSQKFQSFLIDKLSLPKMNGPKYSHKKRESLFTNGFLVIQPDIITTKLEKKETEL